MKAGSKIAHGTPTLYLQNSVLVLINYLSNKITATGSATYRSLFGLSIIEFRILVMLAAEPDIGGQRMSDFIGLDPGAASRALRSLETRGLVFNRQDPNNAAYRRWSLTRSGAELHSRAVKLAIQRTEILLSDFDDAEVAQFVTSLKKMIARLPDIATLTE